MKKIYLPFLLFLFTIALTSEAQTLRVQGRVNSLYLSDCGDCNSSADPRIKTRISTTTQPWSGEYKNERDNVGCDGSLSANPGIYDVSGTPITDAWWVDIRGFESDGFVCGGNDGNCDGYASPTAVSGVILNTWAPSCGGGWNGYNASRTCNSGGTQVYTSITELRYHFDASSLSNANAGGTISLSVPSDANLCVGASNPNQINGNSLLNDRFNTRDWELSTNGGPFVSLGSSGQNYDPPALAAGTYTYRRRLSYCTDFSGGTTSVYSNSVTITVSPLDNASFSYSSASYCSNLANPSPTITGLAGGSFSATAGLFINSTTGVISLASSTPGGPYTVTYTTNGTCPNSATRQVSIVAADNSSFNYAQASYCINSGGTATPAITGLGGGTFSYSPGTGLSFNTGTGAITLASSTAGTYTVNYITNGACPDTSSVSVGVLAQDNSAFTYSSNNFCVNGTTNPLPQITGLTGGTFASAPAGLSLNASTGEITLASSTTGTPYTITYTTAGPCPSSSTFSVIINPAPIVSFTGLAADYCINNTNAIPLSGSPAGGTFSGLGIVGTTYTPSLTTIGTHTITYTYSDGNGCSSSSSQSVLTNGLPFVSISGTLPAYCVSENTPIALTGFPAGGSFSGPGITGTDFTPSTAGSGIHTLTYTYTDPNGCVNSASTQVTVYALPTVAFAGLNTAYCLSQTPSALTGFPSGGTFTGTGLSGASTFDPQVAGAGGPYALTYTFTDANGCTNSSSQTTTVNANPTVSFSGLAAQYCNNNAVASLTGTPTGGTFSGPGISGTNFDPSASGTGTISILYNYTDGNGCSGSNTQSTTVNIAPTVNFAGLASAYCENEPSATLQGFPSGGTFSGTGTSGLIFNPQAAGPGSYTITYTYTDPNGCSNSSSAPTTVNATPAVSFSGLAGTYCISQTTAVPLTGSPTGGTFMVNNVVGGSFIPSVEGLGNHTISYFVTNGQGCSDTASLGTTVVPAPVVSFTGLNSQYCSNATAVTLTGNPTGGTFTGPGITGSSFDPSTAGTGTIAITYSYSDGNGCSNTTTNNTIVVAAPIVNIAGLDAGYCVNGLLDPLTGFPNGGTFSGNGISGTSFNPQVAGTGNHTITYSYTDLNNCTSSTTASTTVYAQPTVSFSGLSTTYCIDNAVGSQLNGNPSGGTFFGPGISSNLFVPATAGLGSHTVFYTYTNGNGCADTVSNTTTVNALPVVSITGLNTNYCAADPASVLTGLPGGGSFSGPGGVSSGSFNPAAAGAGTYNITYTYTDGSGCTNSAQVSTDVYPMPTPPVISPSGPITLCAGSDTLLDAGTGYNTYTWFFNSGVIGNAQSQTVSQAGNYYVTVANSFNCRATSGTVTVNSVAIPVINLGNDTTICLGTSFTLDAGSGYSNYSWSTTATTQTISINAQGIYSVYVTDANGCHGSDAISVLAANLLTPVITTVGNPQICQGDTVVLDAGSYANYLWSDGGQTSTQFFNATYAGTFTVTVTDANGCSGTSAPITIDVLPLPVVNIIANGPTEFCAGSSVTLTADPGFISYQWSNGVVGNSNIINQPGSYVVTVVGQNGCESSSAPVVVDIHTPPQPTITANGPTTFCKGGSVTLSCDPGGLFYLWTTGSTSQAISVNQTGDYWVIVNDGFGCSDSSYVLNPVHVEVVNPQPIITISGNTFTSTSFATYQWYQVLGGGQPDSLLVGQTNQTYVATESGVFYLVVTDQTGCEGSSVVIEHTYNSINENGFFSGFNVYPNPTEDLLTIELGLGKPSPVSFQIFSGNGQLVRTVDLGQQNKQLEKSLRVDNLANGIYTLVVKAGEQTIRTNFVKK
jgi:hypothetical protein